MVKALAALRGLCGLMLVLLATFFAPPQSAAGTQALRAPSAAARLPFGYGLSLADFDALRASQLGFNWVEVYNPPARRLATKVLYRVPLSASDWSSPGALQARLIDMSYYGDFIDSYEIGNEVNLQSEWGAPPDASKYVDVLCAASNTIHLFAPNATIISAGLANTGRVPGTWNGHPGHDGTNQDEREYVKEFLAHGGQQCADAIGYHPLGYRAAYSAAPDFNGGTPETDCSSGLCFRSMEKFADILRVHGVAQPRIWATETGWLTGASSVCQNNDPTWQGRAWQIVTPEQQASNLTGAFSYARAHWPWLEAMFVWNLDFSSANRYPVCEQMRYYSIAGLPAENALAAMPKDIRRAFLPVIASSWQATALAFHPAGLPKPWRNCGGMGIFGLVSDLIGGRIAGVGVQVYVHGGSKLPGADVFTTNRSDDRNYERSLFEPGDYDVVLSDGSHEISPRVRVTVNNVNQCDPGQLGAQWVQVNFRQN